MDNFKGIINCTLLFGMNGEVEKKDSFARLKKETPVSSTGFPFITNFLMGGRKLLFMQPHDKIALARINFLNRLVYDT